MEFKSVIRTIPDYPKPGIMFRDITTLLGNPRAFRRAVDELVQPYAGVRIDKVAGIEARGFILGGAVAHQLSDSMGIYLWRIRRGADPASGGRDCLQHPFAHDVPFADQMGAHRGLDFYHAKPASGRFAPS